MHVLINGLSALKTKTGIGHYTASVIDELTQQADITVSTFPDGWQANAVRRAYGLVAGARKIPAPGKRRSWRSRVLQHSAPLLRKVGNRALLTAFRQRCQRVRPDLYHEPNFIPFPSDVPTIATIHDLSVIAHPEWHPHDRVQAWEADFIAGLKRCHHLIAVSASARRELIDLLGVASERISIVHNGVRSHLRRVDAETVQIARQRLDLPDQFLLHVGTIEPRKNLLMLMRAYVSLPAEYRARCPLVLVGGWGWNTDDVATYYHDVAKHAGVRLLGYIHDDDLPSLYTAARALVYPSLYEGFGLPTLEMMACGGAVLAADIPPIREVTGAHAQLIHPHDADAWRNALTTVIRDEDRVRELQKGTDRHASPFTWSRCAAQTREVYQQVLHGSRRIAA